MSPILRRIALIFSLHLCLCGPTLAEIRLGASGGGTFGRLTTGPKTYQTNGLSGGISAEWSIDPRFGVRLGLLYALHAGEDPSGIPEITRSDYELSSLVVPLGVSFTPRPGWISVRFLAGVGWSYVLDARYFQEHNRQSRDWEIANRLDRKWDLAPMMGIGVGLNGTFEVSAQHSWSMRWLGGGYELEPSTLWLLGTLWFASPL